MCACMCVLLWLGVLVCGCANVSEHSLQRFYMQGDHGLGLLCMYARTAYAMMCVHLRARPWPLGHDHLLCCPGLTACPGEYFDPPPFGGTVGRGATIATAYRGRGRGAGRGTVGGVARAVRSGTARAPFKPQGGNGSTGFGTKVRAARANWICGRPSH